METIPFHKPRRAFTLLETLVAVSLVLALILLVMPVFDKMWKASLNTQCVAHLKMTGTAVLTHAAENNGRSVTALYRPASDDNPNPDPNLPNHAANRVWSQSLQAGGYLGGKPDELVCPAFPPFRYRGVRADGSADKAPAMHTYALRRFSNSSSEGTSESDPAFHIGRVEQPSRYALLMDSYSIDEKAQHYFVRWPSHSRIKIHLRHNGRANIFFADGSVRSLNVEEMTTLNDGLSADSVFTEEQVPLP